MSPRAGSEEGPHHSAAEFSLEKRRHLTEIRNSPHRAGARRAEHPYQPNQPIDPHYSLTTFEEEKRRHQTDIRNSPRRYDTSPRRPPTVCPLADKQEPPYHTSHQEFSIEKSEHFTPVLPVRGPREQSPRDPATFKHQSNTEFSEEIRKCQTPIYPLREAGDESSRRVVDNYLNYSPHPDDFLHLSNHSLAREKSGHLTELHTSRRLKEREASREREPSPADHGLYVSAQELSREKHKHSTELHTSTHRARKPSVERRDLSPQYESQMRFTSDKYRHKATISPQRAREQKSPARSGYASHFDYSRDKRRHSVSPAPVRTPTKSPSQQRGDRDPHGLHLSNQGFSVEKRQHRTSIHNSPPRDRPEPSPRSPSRTFTSRSELERAKRGHHIVLGAGAAGGGRASASPSRVHLSYNQFCSEKRGHHTGIQNARTPPSPSLQTPPASGFRSHARFSEAKRSGRADLSPSRSPAARHSVSPARFTSHAQFRSEKQKHTVTLDGRREPPTPPSVSFSDRSREGSRAPSHAPSEGASTVTERALRD